MYKEVIIIIIVLIFVISLDIITNKYTKYATYSLSNNLSNFREDVLNNNKEYLKDKLDQINNEWEKYKQKLSYYMEHDELEKVGNSLSSLNARIQVKEYNDAIDEIDESIFILQHIEEKERFSLSSLF